MILACASAAGWFWMSEDPERQVPTSEGRSTAEEKKPGEKNSEPDALVAESVSVSNPQSGDESSLAIASPSPTSLQARVETAIGLAQSSSAQALRWAANLPAPERAPALIAAANEMARTNPAEALAVLVELDPSSERDTALAHAAGQWAALDPGGAADWAAEGSPSELREQICSAVAIGMADRDPRGAAEFISAQMSEGVSLRTAAISVVQRWAQIDDLAAKDWAQQFPSGPLRNDALREIEVQRAAKAAVE